MKDKTLLPHEKEEFKTTLSDEEIEDLEKMVDEALEETTRMPITNEYIYQVALENKKEMIDIRKEIIDFNETQKNTNKSLNLFFKKTWKLLFLLFVLSSVVGYSLAVFQHENIKPFFKDIAKEIVKKTIHMDN